MIIITYQSIEAADNKKGVLDARKSGVQTGGTAVKRGRSYRHFIIYHPQRSDELNKESG